MFDSLPNLFNDFRELAREVAVSTASAIRYEIFSKSEPVFKPLYTEQEAADFLGIKKNQLQNYRRNGQINYYEYPAVNQFDEFVSETAEVKRSGLYSYGLWHLLDFAFQGEQLRVPRKLKAEDVLQILEKKR